MSSSRQHHIDEALSTILTKLSAGNYDDYVVEPSAEADMTSLASSLGEFAVQDSSSASVIPESIMPDFHIKEDTSALATPEKSIRPSRILATEPAIDESGLQETPYLVTDEPSGEQDEDEPSAGEEEAVLTRRRRSHKVSHMDEHRARDWTSEALRKLYTTGTPFDYVGARPYLAIFNIKGFPPLKTIQTMLSNKGIISIFHPIPLGSFYFLALCLIIVFQALDWL